MFEHDVATMQRQRWTIKETSIAENNKWKEVVESHDWYRNNDHDHDKQVTQRGVVNLQVLLKTR